MLTSLEDPELHFFHIASPSYDSRSFYHRDLPFLMDLGMDTFDYDLALDLGEECARSCCAGIFVSPLAQGSRLQL